MVRAIDVTSKLVQLSFAGEERDPLTPLRLHKLLYYVQGWYLAAFGKPLFHDRIEAWEHGPVVPSVYQKHRGSREVLSPADVTGASPLPDRARFFVESVWNEYKKYSVDALLKLTHAEPPWLDARKRAGAGPKDKCKETITVSEMQSYFKGVVEPRLIPGLDVEACYRGAAEADMIERGEAQGMTHGEFWTKIRAKRQG